MLERELKLGAGPGFHLPDLEGIADGVRATPHQQVRLETVYWDTAGLSLARWGCSLRHRVAGGKPEGWTVKLPSEGAGSMLERPELEFEGPARRPPAAAVALLRAYIRSRELEPVARLSTLRERIRLVDAAGRRLLEITDDEVSVLEGRRVAARFREIEVEVSEGGDDHLEPVLDRLRKAGAGAADPTPKNIRALGPRAQLPPEVAPREVHGGTAGEALKAAIATSVAQLLQHDPAIRAGTDPESIHQARVAVRRLRSHLRTFGDLLEGAWADELRQDLGRVGAGLGAARDAEVLLERLQARVKELPESDRRAALGLLSGLETEAVEARESARRLLDREAYIALLDRLVEAANDPPLLETAELPAAGVLPQLVAGPWRKLRKAVGGLGPESPDAELHAARIAAKRARYAAEAVAATGNSDAQAFAKAAAALQTVLGEHQDAVTAQAWLRAAGASGRRAFAAGQLSALELGAAARARSQWRRAWKTLKAKRLRRWIPD